MHGVRKRNGLSKIFSLPFSFSSLSIKRRKAITKGILFLLHPGRDDGNFLVERIKKIFFFLSLKTIF